MAKYEYWLTKDGLTLLRGLARDGLTDEKIAEKLGISRSTLSEWKKKYPEISKALEKGKEIVDREAEEHLIKAWEGYYYEEVTKERIVDTGQSKRHGGESELTEEQWEFAQKYFDHRCCYCGSGGEMTKDHIKPLNHGGTLTVDNIIPACRSCNSKKSDNEMMSWYQSTDYYDQYKMQKINEYLKFIICYGDTLFKSEDDAQLVVTKTVRKYMPPNVTALIFWLKNRKPVDYKDKRDVEHSGELKQVVIVDDL